MEETKATSHSDNRIQPDESGTILRMVLDTIPVRVFWKDTNLNYLGCNTLFALDAGASDPEEVIGRNDYQLGWHKEADLYRADDKRVIDSGTPKLFYEEPQTTPDGTTIWLRTSKIPLRDSSGKIIGVLGTYENITELKEAYVALQETDRLKTAFLQNMSHEIRTPLNGIIGFTSLLGDFCQLSDREKEKYISIILTSSDRLLGIVSDILDMSQIDSKMVKVIRKEFPVTDISDFFTALMEPKASAKGLIFKAHTADSLRKVALNSDKDKIFQIVTNLLNNAVKFTTDGEIELTIDETNEGSIEIKVKDTGEGIDPNFSDKVFERFWQYETYTGEPRGGTGLGLSISKELAEMLDCTLTFESVKDQGSTFTLTIPLSSVNHMISKKQVIKGEERHISLNGIKILIAEDDDINYMYLSHMLDKAGAAVVRAVNGQQAVDLAMENRYDMIFMDLKMPVMDGFEATKIIRSRYSDMPIIALTAFALEDDRKKAVKAGCSDFIKKPVFPDNFLQIVIKHL